MLYPSARNIFDFIYSLDALQHTPDVVGAFASLPPMLSKNGSLCVDFYEKTLEKLVIA